MIREAAENQEKVWKRRSLRKGEPQTCAETVGMASPSCRTLLRQGRNGNTRRPLSNAAMKGAGLTGRGEEEQPLPFLVVAFLLLSCQSLISSYTELRG